MSKAARDPNEFADVSHITISHPNSPPPSPPAAEAGKGVETPTPPSQLEHSVHCTAHRDDGTAWHCFIEQLRARGPTWSRYEIRGEIGRGGMGVVYKAFDKDTRRELAMKVILEPAEAESGSGSYRLDDRTLGRFLEEAQVTSQLDHPGIVPVHEIGLDTQCRVYFTMKYVKGEDLRAIYDKVRLGVDGWTVPRAVSVLLKVCEAMAFAHAKGVIHRDLKPSNVMVGRFGEAYVMDWGLARVVEPRVSTMTSVIRRAFVDPDASTIKSARKDVSDSSSGAELVTLDGDVVGTPSYMSPEQARGSRENVGPQSDVYSVGAMLYHLLAGHAPYRDGDQPLSPQTITSLVLVGPPRPLSDIAVGAPPELVAICEKAMARELSSRYTSMGRLADDLRAWLENRVVSAYESGSFAEIRKWMRRNRGAALTATFAILVIVGISSFYLRSLIAREEVARTEASRADRNAKEAEKNAIEAKKRTQEVEIAHQSVMRLSDATRIQHLVRDWDTLWPAVPELAPRMQDWLRRARELVGHRAAHEATLATLREHHRGLPHPDEAKLADLRAIGKSDEAAALARRIESERDYDFQNDEQGQWWHDTLRDLVVALAALDASDSSALYKPTIASMETRLRFAETVEQRSIRDHQVDWNDTLAAIAASPLYHGLRIQPQLGLVPLGPDPKSGLFEFALLQTGDVPVRDRTSGKLAIGGDTGVVFVLLPGGKYQVGAQKKDPKAPHFDDLAADSECDGPEVSLDPFFMSKFELTQGQWLRITGEAPSHYHPPFAHEGVAITWQNPVEQVSFDDVVRITKRLGLGVTVPTFAQWEYAARGGSDSRYLGGATHAGLDKFANLSDLFCKTHGGPPSWTYDDDLDDGFVMHAPVGSLDPNGFGLHDVIGNVWEWCREPIGDLAKATVHPGDGEMTFPRADSSFRATRGASYNDPASETRLADYQEQTAHESHTNLGVRLSRSISR